MLLFQCILRMNHNYEFDLMYLCTSDEGENQKRIVISSFWKKYNYIIIMNLIFEFLKQ